MLRRLSPFLAGLMASTTILAACGDQSPVATDSPASPRLDLSTISSETGPCPPALPPGYVLHTCFNFTPIDGVFHGFSLGRSVAQPPETVNGAHILTRLNWDYLLITPTGYRRIEAGGAIAPSPAAGLTAFQAEYNGSEWFDVFRIMRHPGTRSGPMTVAIARRSRTVRTTTTDLLRAVSAFRAEGRLTAAQASSLTRLLRLAIEYQDSGRSSDARTALESFIVQVQAPSGLTAAQSNALVVGARDVIARITP